MFGRWETVTITDGTAVATAADFDEERWKDRRLTSWSIRVVAAALPLLAAAVVTALHLSVFERPAGALPKAAFWTGVLAGAAVTAVFLSRWTRRLLPLAGLFRMTLAFPGAAPNRFAVALRETNASRLETQLIAGSIDPDTFAARNLISMIGLLRHHDHATRNHSERVATYATLIGEQMGLRPDEIDKLRWAALIHDIGKLSVPPRVLNAVDPLSDEDHLLIRNHPVAAAAYLEVVSAWLGEWALAGLEHHERWDGSGYPAGIRGDAIGRAGRIVAVADAYDVMTTASSCRSPLPVDRAREELARCAGTQFDPAVVHALLQIPHRRLRLLLGPSGWLNDLAWTPRVSTRPKIAISTAIAALGVATGMAVLLDPTSSTAPELAAERVVEGGTTTTISQPSTSVLGETAAEEPAADRPTAPPLDLPETTIPHRTPTTTTTLPLVALATVPDPTGVGFVLVDPSDLPRHLGDGELTSNDHAFVWFEPSTILDTDVPVNSVGDGGVFAGDSTTTTVLSGGLTVCPAFVHVDPADSLEAVVVELDFGIVPLGFVLRGEDLDATRSFGVEGVDHRSDGMGADDVGSIDGTTIRLMLTHSVAGRDQLRLFFPC